MFRTCVLAMVLLAAAVDAQVSGTKMGATLSKENPNSRQDGDPVQVEKLLSGADEGDTKKVREALEAGVWTETKDASASPLVLLLLLLPLPLLLCIYQTR